MSVYLPLEADSKAPAVKGWTRPDYEGVPYVQGAKLGLRADGLVIMDFDTSAAYDEWMIGHPERTTLLVRTPRGYHAYYRHTHGSPEGPMVGVFPDTDVRAGRGSYVVAPGYEGYSIVRTMAMALFDPGWLPVREQRVNAEHDEWDTIGEGTRNHQLTVLAGTLRKQGASPQAMARALAAVNAVIVDPPLELDEVRQIAASVSRYTPDPEPVIEVVT